MVRNVLAVIGLASVALVTGVAINAQYWAPGFDARPPAVKVGFADLNLDTPQGQQRLDRRIKSAVDRVCGRADIRDLAMRRQQLNCRRDAFRSTTTQVAAAINRARIRTELAQSDDAGATSGMTGGR